MLWPVGAAGCTKQGQGHSASSGLFLVLSEQVRQPSGSGSRAGLFPVLGAAQRGEMEP